MSPTLLTDSLCSYYQGHILVCGSFADSKMMMTLKKTYCSYFTSSFFFMLLHFAVSAQLNPTM